jgi:hypothetical protein
MATKMLRSDPDPDGPVINGLLDPDTLFTITDPLFYADPDPACYFDADPNKGSKP